jgi:hypothetical protein
MIFLCPADRSLSLTMISRPIPRPLEIGMDSDVAEIGAVDAVSDGAPGPDQDALLKRKHLYMLFVKASLRSSGGLSPSGAIR